MIHFVHRKDKKMKKHTITALLFFLGILLMPLAAQAESSSPTKDELFFRSQNQDNVEQLIQEVFGSYDAFKNYGTVYFADDGTITLGFTERNEKVKTFENKVNDLLRETTLAYRPSLMKETAPIVHYKRATYSTSDLEHVEEQLWSKMRQLGLPEQNKTMMTSIDTEHEKVILEVHNMSSIDKEKLTQALPSIVEIQENADLSSPHIQLSRERDWTKLGGGIRVHDSEGNYCTTAGVAKKGNRYFLLTAGHCLNGDKSVVYQGSTVVGHDHSTANYTGIDVGLISLDANTLASGRYATRLFYEHAEDKSDYDSFITGYAPVYQNAYVCKSGITTGVTCGYVTKSSTTVNFANDRYGELKTAFIRGEKGSFYSRGGDSGAITYDPVTHKLYGIHVGGVANGTYGWMTKITDVIDHYSSPNEPFLPYSNSQNIKLS
ncbi:hypothetical protein BEH_15905 [Priestia filamentosa]|uniref:Uncharacterized protein n=2 Tax=Priestia filamentosa TaxID=1402861 RepID=A0A0H4KH29_9BACI|nr:hypothetical protein BEH_15905 [Priestia filamentosa]RJS63274.1 hypothetical protein CJ485_00460 [Priestia filamentosa]